MQAGERAVRARRGGTLLQTSKPFFRYREGVCEVCVAAVAYQGQGTWFSISGRVLISEQELCRAAHLPPHKFLSGGGYWGVDITDHAGLPFDRG